ncbi:MAG: PEGA domain-containing protein [Acidobacteria bacterium]|nr:PEGA domain-containing protein [Acidobacteriota bacterium]
MSRIPRRHLNLIAVPLLLAAMLALWPSTAEAQRRRYPARSVIVVGGSYGYPWYPYYGMWPQFGYPWGPWGGPPYYGYPMQDQLTASVRVDVTPRDAEVFVDGYSAGRVDDFDGVFQRLRLRPGNHEVTLYKPGYRTIRQNIYVGPRSDQKIRFDMEPLAAGETSEAPPQPTTPREEQGRFPFDEPFGPEPPQPPSQGAPPPDAARAPARFGTLSVRVQPADAEILVDGERWSAPATQDRLTIQLAEGRHQIEVRKAGFASYREDVLIRRDRALTLNVSLLRGDGQ